NEDHEFVVEDPLLLQPFTVTMRSATLAEDPVRILDIVDTPQGAVGHLLFTQHTAPSELQLIDAVNTLAAAGVTDLFLDVRYNGGGFLDIANELAYMIAGAAAAGGRVFTELEFNGKHTAFNPVTGQALGPDFFHSTTQGFSTAIGNPLPSLNLNRVYVLTTAESCSASEAIINGLRGIDFEVIQIGSPTCGKPYGFYAPDNCGTTYFSIQFRSVNAKGFGDYPDGFAPQNLGQAGAVALPGCAVNDDVRDPTFEFGEAHFVTALGYREGLGCPALPVAASTSAPAGAISLPQKGSPAGAIVAPSVPGAVMRSSR
ncbi:MAG: S41 family peptidase, partial [Gammaproteobacteria bacterium]|nr:S41 family peptidase [Gammaproteobacteria bacterium]